MVQGSVQRVPQVDVRVLGLGAMLQAWFLRRLPVTSKKVARFPGWMPFRAFFHRDLQCIFYFAPFVPRALRRRRRRLRDARLQDPGLEAPPMAAGDLWVALHDDGTEGAWSTALRKDRELVFLHEAWFHGWAGRRGHEPRGIGALNAVTRFRTSSWDHVELAWSQLVTSGVVFRVL